MDRVRGEFPGLSRSVGQRPATFFDGPAGSQVPRSVIEAVSGCLAQTNANVGGFFETSREAEALLTEARCAVADLLGTSDSEAVIFGPNMTTLTLALSRALSRTLRPDDEIVVTQLEHDANFTPWVQAARDAGSTVREAKIRSEDCTLDMEDLKSKVNERTRLVAVTAASNLSGTKTPVGEIVRVAHAAGAEVFVDAVHYAPHAPIDVDSWGCDYIACSPYKFFGPHLGILWGKREALEKLPAYKLRTASDGLPGRWETGTQNHEGVAGTLAAVEYLAALGREGTQTTDRRAALLDAFRAIGEHERGLLDRLLRGLAQLPEIRVWGITAPERYEERVPTVALTHSSRTPEEIARDLGEQGIFVWNGNFYALAAAQALGLEPDGVVRVGLLHYNTIDEVDRLVAALGDR